MRGQDPEPPSTAVTRSTQTTVRRARGRSSRAAAARCAATSTPWSCERCARSRRRVTARRARWRATSNACSTVVRSKRAPPTAAIAGRSASGGTGGAWRPRQRWSASSRSSPCRGAASAFSFRSFCRRWRMVSRSSPSPRERTRKARASSPPAPPRFAGVTASRRARASSARRSTSPGFPPRCWPGTAGHAPKSFSARQRQPLRPGVPPRSRLRPDLPEPEGERLRLRGLAAEGAWIAPFPVSTASSAAFRIGSTSAWISLRAPRVGTDGSGRSDTGEDRADSGARRRGAPGSPARLRRGAGRLSPRRASARGSGGDESEAWAEAHAVPPLALRAERLHATRSPASTSATRRASSSRPSRRSWRRQDWKTKPRSRDSRSARSWRAPPTTVSRRRCSRRLSRRCGWAGDRTGESAALAALAFQASKSGDFEAGLALSRQAVDLARELGDRWIEGEALVTHLALSNWAGDARGVAATRELTVRALRESGNRQMLLSTLNNLALDAIENLELDRAQSYLNEAATLASGSATASPTPESSAPTAISRSREAPSMQPDSATNSALAQARRTGTPLSAAAYLADLAWLEVAADRPEPAAARAREAIAAHAVVGKRRRRGGARRRPRLGGGAAGRPAGGARAAGGDAPLHR